MLCVQKEVGGYNIRLTLASEEPFDCLPQFWLTEPQKLGKRAHVLLRSLRNEMLGFVCVNDRDSVSVNFSLPLLVVEESLKRHFSLLERAITDSTWNEQELLREFYSNWLQNCISERKELLVCCSDPKLQRLNVYSPMDGAKYGIESHYLVEPADYSLSSVSQLRYSAKNSKRNISGKAIVVPIEALTPAPSTEESLAEWYINTIQALPVATKQSLQQFYGQWRDKEYWVIFTAITILNERAWFAVKLTCQSKKTLPTTLEKLKNWQVQALAVRMFSQENVVRRGGGNPNLKGKNVALVGAGSVGCEIAHKLSSAGVRNLTIFDDDVYSMENLYRHTLPERLVGFGKSPALVGNLHSQFPWSNATWSTKLLLELCNNTKALSQYDLIVIAIGRPTHELLFKKYLLDSGIKVPVINCWLEGFGVGGHAVLDVPDNKGCLLCSYVCLESGRRGLSSNLNFIEQNQNVTKNTAGCGDQFISYGAVCSAQTAIMATDLAIKFLEGKVTESCKVSWKGDDTDAVNEGIRLNHRYYHFEKSLERLPLLDEDCDICN